jgi:SAM-dependent methyltransferase
MLMLSVADAVLEHPVMYRTLHSATGLRRLHSRLLRDVLRRFDSQDGLRILDLGCGPGDTLKLIGASGEYTGIDLNPRYVAKATRNARAGASFIVADVTQLDTLQFKDYDLIIAFGLIHHLNDRQVNDLLAAVASMLKPKGRMVTLDGCYRNGMSSVVAWLLRHDRGRYVRQEQAYLELFSRHLRIETTFTDPAAMRIPYAILSIVGTSGAHE